MISYIISQSNSRMNPICSPNRFLFRISSVRIHVGSWSGHRTTSRDYVPSNPFQSIHFSFSLRLMNGVFFVLRFTVSPFFGEARGGGSPYIGHVLTSKLPELFGVLRFYEEVLQLLLKSRFLLLVLSRPYEARRQTDRDHQRKEKDEIHIRRKKIVEKKRKKKQFLLSVSFRQRSH